MKPVFFLVLLSVALSTQAQTKTGQQPFLTKSLANENVNGVEAETSGGNIAVTGGTADPRVEVYIRRSNSRNGEADLTKNEIQTRLDADYTLDVSVNNGKVTAKARPKRNNMDWKHALSISFRIYVPQTVSTDLTTSGGNIELSNLSGTKKFTTSGGNLDLERISGKTKGSTSGGNIYLKDSKDDLSLSTSGGNIEASNCTGTMSLMTSGGSIRLRNLNGDVAASTSGGNVEGQAIEGSLSAHTSGGNVQLEDLACRLETSTSGGQIDVALKSLKNSVSISNSGGNIRLQLPKGAGADLDLHADRVKADHLETFSGSVEDDQIRGKLNGGGTSVRVTAGSGRVSLSFQ